jgi:hypothetical protein
MGPFESFYESALQHPWLLWLSALLAGAFALSRRRLDPSVARLCAVLVALSLADAWLTSGHVYGLGSLSGRAASWVPLFFVLAGDFRFLLLFGAATPRGALAFRASGLAAAAALTVVVPITSQLAMWTLPLDAGTPRVLFLVYELLFTVLALALLRWHPAASRAPWLAQVCRFVLIYYPLWACADALILAGAREPGFALRVVPNLLYYGGLIAVIAWTADDAAAPRDPSPAAAGQPGPQPSETSTQSAS